MHADLRAMGLDAPAASALVHTLESQIPAPTKWAEAWAALGHLVIGKHSLAALLRSRGYLHAAAGAGKVAGPEPARARLEMGSGVCSRCSCEIRAGYEFRLVRSTAVCLRCIGGVS